LVPLLGTATDGKLRLVRGRLKVVLGLVAVSALTSGCGGDERHVPTVSVSEHRAEVARNPYALTCRDLARQPLNSINQRLVINVEFALSKEPVLRERAEEMTDNRVGRSIYWALTEICKGHALSYEPARDAVKAVQGGKYLVQPRPKSWSKPELWSHALPEEPGD
jgi:hypothetical protein